MPAESRYDILIRTDAELAALKDAQTQLREVTGAAKAVGAEAPVAAEGLARVEQALAGDKVGRYAKSLEDLAAKERAAGRATDDLERELRGLETAAGDAEKKTSGFGDVFAGSFLGGIVSGAVTQITGELNQMAFEAVALADNLADLAGKAGTSASSLQRIGNAAADNGSSIAAAADGMAKLTVNAEKALAGNKNLAESFARLGVPIEALKGLSPDQLFLRIADAVSTTSDRGRAFADVSATMGAGAKDLFATLSLGSGEIQRLGESFGVFSDETIAKLAAAKQSIDQFKSKLTIFVGDSISAIGGLYQHLSDDQEITRAYSRLFGLTTEQIKQFEALKLKGEAAGTGTADKLRDAAGAAEELAGSAGDAADKLAKIDETFAKRNFDKLPLEGQAASLQQQLADLRAEAEKLAGTDVTFGTAADFNVIANGLGKDSAAAKQLALDMAKIEDALEKVTAAHKKTGPAATDASREQIAAAKAAQEAIEKERLAIEKKNQEIRDAVTKTSADLERARTGGSVQAFRDAQNANNDAIRAQNQAVGEAYQKRIQDAIKPDAPNAPAAPPIPGAGTPAAPPVPPAGTPAAPPIPGAGTPAAGGQKDAVAQAAADATAELTALGQVAADGLGQIATAAADVAAQMPPAFARIDDGFARTIAAVESSSAQTVATVQSGLAALAAATASRDAALQLAIDAAVRRIDGLERRA